MSMKEVITKAIQGGWNDRLYRVDTGNSEVWTHHSSLLLDPLFWQALGKAEGWPEDSCRYCGKKFSGSIMSCINQDCPNPQFASSGVNACIFYWHHFIDHLASGGEAEQFFKSLLK